MQDGELSQKMHFRAEMTVMLDDLLPTTGRDGSSEEPAVGYIVVFGVNAPDLSVATKYAHDTALCPMKVVGTFRSFQGVVTNANVRRIEKTDWEPAIQQNAKRIDKEGVYYSTGLILFGKDK